VRWLALATLAPAIAAAEPVEELIELGGDRPDFTESALVVPPGALQVEGGMTWVRSDSATTEFQAAELALRYGCWKRFEWRLALPNYVRVSADGARVAGASDPLFGFKVQAGPLPTKTELAVIVQASLPTGSSELTSDRVDPEVKVPFSHPLGGPWSLNGQASLFFPTFDGTRDSVFQPTLSVARELTARSGAFVEYIGEFSRLSTDFNLLHAGYTYQPLPRLQLDVHAAFGISNAAPDFFLGVGFVWRPTSSTSSRIRRR
jgi:hypothetical protein